MMGRVPFYQLKIVWNEADREALSLVFTNPPTRQHLREIMLPSWRELPKSRQDDAWEYVLILDEIPEEPWTGQIPSIYGLITCRMLHLLDNQ